MRWNTARARGASPLPCRRLPAGSGRTGGTGRTGRPTASAAGRASPRPGKSAALPAVKSSMARRRSASLSEKRRIASRAAPISCSVTSPSLLATWPMTWNVASKNERRSSAGSPRLAPSPACRRCARPTASGPLEPAGPALCRDVELVPEHQADDGAEQAAADDVAEDRADDLAVPACQHFALRGAAHARESLQCMLTAPAVPPCLRSRPNLPFPQQRRPAVPRRCTSRTSRASSASTRARCATSTRSRAIRATCSSSRPTASVHSTS